MADKNIQIKSHNGVDWDSLFPKTKASITMLSNGKTVETSINEMLISISQKATSADITTEVEKVVGSAPAALDTLKELADALNNDSDFATTIANNLSNKVDKLSGKGLSTEDFTTTLKNKLNSLQDYSSEISSIQTNKADKSNTYTRTEIDTKISNINSGIPVQSAEPTDSEMWFEELL